MPAQHSLFDFDSPRRQIEEAISAADFRAVDLIGPVYAGKSRLLAEMLVVERRPELVVYVDFKRRVGPDDLVRLLITRTSTEEFLSTKENLRQLNRRDVEIQRSTIRNSQVIINAGASTASYREVAALSFADDVRALSRRLVVALDHSSSCSPESVAIVECLISALHDRDKGCVIVTRRTPDRALEVLARGDMDVPFDGTLLARTGNEVAIPRFSVEDIQEYARHLNVPVGAVDFATVARTSQGIPGMVTYSLMSVAFAEQGA